MSDNKKDSSVTIYKENKPLSVTVSKDPVGIGISKSGSLDDDEEVVLSAKNPFGVRPEFIDYGFTLLVKTTDSEFQILPERLACDYFYGLLRTTKGFGSERCIIFKQPTAIVLAFIKLKNKIKDEEDKINSYSLETLFNIYTLAHEWGLEFLLGEMGSLMALHKDKDSLFIPDIYERYPKLHQKLSEKMSFSKVLDFILAFDTEEKIDVVYAHSLVKTGVEEHTKEKPANYDQVVSKLTDKKFYKIVNELLAGFDKKAFYITCSSKLGEFSTYSMFREYPVIFELSVLACIDDSSISTFLEDVKRVAIKGDTKVNTLVKEAVDTKHSKLPNSEKIPDPKEFTDKFIQYLQKRTLPINLTLKTIGQLKDNKIVAEAIFDIYVKKNTMKIIDSSKEDLSILDYYPYLPLNYYIEELKKGQYNNQIKICGQALNNHKLDEVLTSLSKTSVSFVVLTTAIAQIDRKISSADTEFKNSVKLIIDMATVKIASKRSMEELVPLITHLYKKVNIKILDEPAKSFFKNYKSRSHALLMCLPPWFESNDILDLIRTG